jgi:hypothetical protein
MNPVYEKLPPGILHSLEESILVISVITRGYRLACGVGRLSELD